MSIARLSLLCLGLLVGGRVPLQAGQTAVGGDLVAYGLVARATSPIVVDGRLDEFDWQLAEQINGFERILNDYDRIRHPTRARMLWDDQGFYFAFACQDADIWAIYDGEDEALWEEEVVEVFIDPDGDARRYLELEVNPLNTVVDLLIYQVESGFDSSRDWDIAGLQTAVQVVGTVSDSLAADQGWTVEIAIPWSAMADSVGGGGKPQPGDQWRLNLYRIERRGGRALKAAIDTLNAQARPLMAQSAALHAQADSLAAAGASPGRSQRRRLAQLEEELAPIAAQLKPLHERYNEQTEYTAWSETYQRGFHHPQRFGVVEFAR
ncbi:MAG: carbohydrate-binding family 9-like protein [Candidatus Latescibacterota bacterium]